MKRFSQAADNNKTAILTVLAEWLPDKANLLEIGSGSGQHAIHMAAALQHIRWQPSERADMLHALNSNILAYGSPNICNPAGLDLKEDLRVFDPVDCIYSANVMHIVSEELGEKLIRGAAKALRQDGLLALYGPYKYRGEFTTRSNAEFDLRLKERDAQSGVRDFEWVTDIANNSGLTLAEDRSMPANNKFLAFKRKLS